MCGDQHAHLHQLDLKYWLNPNQVYQSGLKDTQFKLADARSICLLDCPVPSEDSLNWVCDYPEGDIRMSMDDWIDRNYDYFEFLDPEMRNTSLRLQGPCYPVIFPSVNGEQTIDSIDCFSSNDCVNVLPCFWTLVETFTIACSVFSFLFCFWEVEEEGFGLLDI